MPFDAAEHLFPSDLHVADAGLNSLLMIGGCGSGAFAQHFAATKPAVHVDHLLFNNVAQLPLEPPRSAADYDLQVVEIPLREVLGDATFRFDAYQDPQRAADLLEHGLRACAAAFAQATAYTRRFGLLTCVLNFVTPQTPVAASLDLVGGSFDLRWLIAELNRELARLASESPNTYLCDVDALGAAIGKRFFLDDVMGFYGHSGHWTPAERDFDVAAFHNAPAGGRLELLPEISDVYEPRFHELYAVLWRAWEHVVRVARRLDPVKLVVFDLDDTLWRGQLGEHYADVETRPVFHGWPTGVWEAVHHLRARGVLAAVCSKNDPEIVVRDWDRAVHDRWLTLEDFTFVEIGWGPKAEAVGRLMAKASLTPNSVLFVDDNPVEREAVCAAHPGLRTLGANPYVTRRVLLWSAETQVATLTAESRARDGMMRAQQVREGSRAALTREAFLESLDARVNLYELPGQQDVRYARAFELLNKTNQFNTTGVRWSSAELVAFTGKGGRVVAFEVSDRFTNYGLVGVLLLQGDLIEQFVMSCRVIGLEVELAVLSAITGARRGRVRETASNAVCRDVYLRAGFEPAAEQLFQRSGASPASPRHLVVTSGVDLTAPLVSLPA